MAVSFMEDGHEGNTFLLQTPEFKPQQKFVLR
jgi:hypothetical protein